MNRKKWIVSFYVLAFGGFGLSFSRAGFAHDASKTSVSCDHFFEAVARAVDWNQSWLKNQTALHQAWQKESLHPLWSQWVAASARMTAMNSAVTAMSKTDQSYFAPIVKAAVAAMTKHQLDFVSEHHLKSLDVPRHLAILRAIGEFSPAEPRFSLYKIKRAIEGRYSLREYTGCR